uniref:Dihydroorotate dehydrogenase (quinone), mitochondrial n=1 Tax=Timema cristinae TaxID=61476 RepID=A0A7R9CAB8_TIMCR|nr:unnamed protein product [Timema cristinae]
MGYARSNHIVLITPYSASAAGTPEKVATIQVYLPETPTFIFLSLVQYKIKSMLYVTSSAVGLCTAVSIYRENERFYDGVLMPLIQVLDPETSHNFAITVSKYGLFPKSKYKDSDSLKTEVWRLNFKNPVGIAAGFDKQGEAIECLHNIGFGFVEIGSVTPKPQPGNEKPRVFRLDKDKAIINRYGFNSEGHDVVYNRIKYLKSKQGFTGIIGVNLGKNKDSKDPIDDYVQGIIKFGDVADYLVINISSLGNKLAALGKVPNRLHCWLRDRTAHTHYPSLSLSLTQSDSPTTCFITLLCSLYVARNNLPGATKPPLLLKVAPDLSQQDRIDIADVILQDKCHIDGLVISNTTVERVKLLNSEHTKQEGGLSGKPLTHLATELIADMYRLTSGTIPIVGVGGIFSGQDAYEKILAGACLVQLYTSFAYHGPPIVTRIKQELDELVRQGYFVTELKNNYI